MKKLLTFLFGITATLSAYGATVVATINGTPVTDTDITARTQLMTRQGKTSTDNRRIALQNIIDDHVKLEYAANFGVKPTDKDANSELETMKMTDLSESELAIARQAIRADIAWQVIVARTIVPMVDVSDKDIQEETVAIAREHGLPIEMTLVRLVDIPQDVANKLTKPNTCDDAIKMAQDLGGAPQKFTALQYELSTDMRNRVADLPLLTWSKRVDNSVLLICDIKKTDEYGKLDDIIKQNTIYKQAMFLAEQQLKQLRRKATVVIHDDRYKL